jgi:putative ABC transport system ATP-binding protein
MAAKRGFFPARVPARVKGQIMTKPDAGTPAYRTAGLTKVYGEGHSAVHALRGVDLEIPAGEIVVLLGPSGSGKSTLLNIVGGLDRGTQGTVHFRDQCLSDMSDAQLTRYRRNHVGFVFQFYNLMPSLTARENVELVTEIANNPMDPDEALALVGLRERVDHFPAQLSGGEQQRVAIARAIAKRPDVLFCDEPTGALDSKTGRAVLQVLHDVNVELGSTVMMVTHNVNTAGMADRVIHFADGNIREITVNKKKISPSEIEW